jgi:exodeoxyribonuclease VII large subunit
VAVITSPDGAALHDVISVAKSRSADVQVILVAAKVQGEGAPESLVRAIDRVCRWNGADVLIIGRGGGAREDLWAFNDERVARALAACPMPTISAVGHEVDLTICDLVADVRAATPSAAAELAVPSRREVIAQVASLGKRLAAAAQRREDRAIASLGQVQKRLSVVAGRLVERRRARLEMTAGRLHALSPLATLARGFAVARTPEGATLGSRAQIPTGRVFDLWLRDGIVSATAGVGRPLPPGIPESTLPETR